MAILLLTFTSCSNNTKAQQKLNKEKINLKNAPECYRDAVTLVNEIDKVTSKYVMSNNLKDYKLLLDKLIESYENAENASDKAKIKSELEDKLYISPNLQRKCEQEIEKQLQTNKEIDDIIVASEITYEALEQVHKEW